MRLDCAPGPSQIPAPEISKSNFQAALPSVARAPRSFSFIVYPGTRVPGYPSRAISLLIQLRDFIPNLFKSSHALSFRSGVQRKRCASSKLRRAAVPRQKANDLK
eukprot:1652019-Rhodomonas_salina.1